MYPHFLHFPTFSRSFPHFFACTFSCKVIIGTLSICLCQRHKYILAYFLMQQSGPKKVFSDMIAGGKLQGFETLLEQFRLISQKRIVRTTVRVVLFDFIDDFGNFFLMPRSTDSCHWGGGHQTHHVAATWQVSCAKRPPRDQDTNGLLYCTCTPPSPMNALPHAGKTFSRRCIP